MGRMKRIVGGFSSTHFNFAQPFRKYAQKNKTALTFVRRNFTMLLGKRNSNEETDPNTKCRFLTK